MALFNKLCPQCGRRYPKNFDTCLECGGQLVDADQAAQKADLTRHLPLIGKVLAGVLALVIILFVIVPLLQHSFISGQEAVNTSRSRGELTKTNFTMNEVASDGNLEVGVTNTRDGARSANSKKFFIITVVVRNLLPDREQQITSADFMLFDPSGGSKYPAYSLSDKVSQTIKPGSAGTYDVVFEIPQDTRNLRLQYTFASTGERGSQTVDFVLL